MVISYKNSEYLRLRKRDSETLGSCGHLTFNTSPKSLPCSYKYNCPPAGGPRPPQVNVIIWKSPQWKPGRPNVPSYMSLQDQCSSLCALLSRIPAGIKPSVPAAWLTSPSASQEHSLQRCRQRLARELLSKSCLGFAGCAQKELRPPQADCPGVSRCPDKHPPIVPPRKWLQTSHCSLMSSRTVFTPSSLNKEAACEASDSPTNLTPLLPTANEIPLLPPVLGDKHSNLSRQGGWQVCVTALAASPWAGCWCQSDDVAGTAPAL